MSRMFFGSYFSGDISKWKIRPYFLNIPNLGADLHKAFLFFAFAEFFYGSALHWQDCTR